MPDAPPQNPPAPATSAPPADRYRTTRLVAMVAGLVSVLLAVATPFLPVEVDTASVSWPQNGSVAPVEAPLVSQAPLTLSAHIPCTAVAQLPPSGGILLATAPPSGAEAPLEAMFVRVSETSVDVLDRNVVIADAPRDRVETGGCDAIVITSDVTGTRASFSGLTDDSGAPRAGGLDNDYRPLVVGVFSDLQSPVPGLDVRIEVDTRFTSSPTPVKLAAMILAVLLMLVALVALARLDGSDGRGHRRVLPSSWWRLRPVDGVVVGTLVLWHFVGANTSDDGYLLTMARVSGDAGYMANYFRWFGVPEAPFGWYYDVLAAMTHVSTASPWMRLPALVAAILCWMVISREVVPRLGRAARHNAVALWTGGMVFLAFWLPFDNGLRPEPVVALGALLTWCSIERAIATGRLLPAAIAALVGAFTLAAAPTGLMCVAAILAGLRQLTRIVVRRHREVGTLPLLAPIAASGFVVLVVVFADQTFAAVREATRVRTIIGPNEPWYNDFLRYYYLFVDTVDGSLARRFAFLILLLCTLATMLVLLRRRRVPGVAVGPAWRLIGIVFGTIFFMMFNPTKWTHHFGAYAGIAGSIAALTAVVVGAAAVRSRRNRSIFLAGLMFALAISFAGINGYWYVSSYGVPWFDKTVQLKGYQSSTLFLGLFALALVLVAWQYLRDDNLPTRDAPSTGRGRLIRRWSAAPLTVIAAAMVLFEVLSLVKGAVSQYPAYSLTRSNVGALAGNVCGLADDVLVESDTDSGRLEPIIDPATPPANGDPLAGVAPKGFTPDGIPTELESDSVFVKPGQGNTERQGIGGGGADGTSGGTGGGTGAVTVNGSSTKLPFGLDPATTPVLGSWQDGVQEPASLVSAWYALPERSDDAPLVVVSAAGRIWSVDDTGKSTYGQSLVVEYGTRQADGTVSALGTYLPRDIGPAPTWRNLRVPLADLPPDVDAVRIVANDPNLTGDQWLAFTPPRVPRLDTLNDVVGTTQPVLLDWAVGLQFPCQRPFRHRDGIAEMPNYRILPDRPLAVSSTDTWQSADNGGPLGFTEVLARPEQVPTYLRDDWARDWGSLERYVRFHPEATPAEPVVGSATRSGFWTPGTLRVY